MATSSILESVRISNPRSAEILINALDESSKMPMRKSTGFKLETDPAVMKKILEKAKVNAEIIKKAKSGVSTSATPSIATEANTTTETNTTTAAAVVEGED